MTDGMGIAVITALGALLLEFVRRMMKSWSTTQVARSSIMKEIADNQRADNIRVVDMMIGQARSDAKLVEEIHLISHSLDASFRARDKMDDAIMDELKEMIQLTKKQQEMLSKYAEEAREFRSRGSYR